MNSRKMAEQVRLTNWSEMVMERMSKGQDVKTYCKENEISLSTYYHRQKKVRDMACASIAEIGTKVAEPPPQGWTQISEIETISQKESQLSIEIGSCKIEVSQNTDTDLLLKTCKVLMSLC